MKEETAPLIQLNSVSYSHSQSFSLHIPSFKVEKGDAVGIVGPNGSGKSTLLNLLSFLVTPHQGGIFYNGYAVKEKDLVSLRRKVTLLTQRPYLLKRSVFDNVAYGLKVRGKIPKLQLENAVFESLKQVGLSPESFSKRHWFELSGGEAQRVALAARLILKPEVLVLDEPVASVDPKSADLIGQAIHSIREKLGVTIIATSHDLVWLTMSTNRMIRMAEGKIIGSGIENIIAGPWKHVADELWCRSLPEAQKIYSINPPKNTSSAILHPSDIIISKTPPLESSARNVLKGHISALTAFETGEGIKGELKVAGLRFVCSLTRQSVSDLQLYPGEEVWLIFKASALQW